MTKTKAIKLASDASAAELYEMLKHARQQVQDWRAPSASNPKRSLGSMFNQALNHDFDGGYIPYWGKVAMLIDFGEFFKRKSKHGGGSSVVHHEEPEALDE